MLLEAGRGATAPLHPPYRGFFIFGGFKFGLGSPGKCPGIEILDFDVLILAEAEFRRFWDDLVDFVMTFNTKLTNVYENWWVFMRNDRNS